MAHALTLALVYAIVVQATGLLHVAGAAWAATRQVAVEPLNLVGAALATALGAALAADAVTAALADPVTAGSWTGALGWLGWLGAALLGATLLLHETTSTGHRWRATAANAGGLVAIGVTPAMALPLGLGLALAVMAGIVAPDAAAVHWLPLAALALVVTALRDRPRARATLAALVAWAAGALVGGLELLLPPAMQAIVVAVAALVALGVLAPRLLRAAAG